MGYRSTWIAVRTETVDGVLMAAGLAPTNETSEFLDTGLWLLQLDEWSVVIASGWDYMELLSEELARGLSDESPAVFWMADDTPMTARMAEYRGGQRVWALTHSQGESSLEGEPPQTVMDALAAQRAAGDSADADPDVDYLYDTAHVAGEKLVGFRHDESPPEHATLRVLLPDDAPKRVTKCGPIHAVAIELPGHDAVVILKAKRKVRIQNVIELHFSDGELRSVVERGELELHGDEEHCVFMSSPFEQLRLRIDVTGLFDKSYEVVVRSDGVGVSSLTEHD